MPERMFTNRPELLEKDSGWEKPLYMRTAEYGEVPASGVGAIATASPTGGTGVVQQPIPIMDEEVEELERLYNRRQFRRSVFDQLGGNPFAINPQEALQQANRNLPALFNYVFRGEIAYSDVGKLNKREREVWEDAKKQYRAKKFNEANTQRDQGIEMYKLMMAEFEAEKRDYAEQLKRKWADKPRVRALNSEGVMTWHERQRDGSFRDTGLVAESRKEGIMANAPAKVRQAWQMMKSLRPDEDPKMAMMKALIIERNPEFEKDPMYKALFPEVQLTENQKQIYSDAESIVTKWIKEERQQFVGPTEEEQKAIEEQQAKRVKERRRTTPTGIAEEYSERMKGIIKGYGAAERVTEGGITYERAPDGTLRRVQKQ